MCRKLNFYVYLVLYSLMYTEGTQIMKLHNLYRFDTKPVGNEEKDSFEQNYIDINVIYHGIPFGSISYCLRIAPRDLFPQCIFFEDGIKFIFIDQRKFFGFVFFHGIYYIFKFPEEIAIIPEQSVDNLRLALGTRWIERSSIPSRPARVG